MLYAIIVLVGCLIVCLWYIRKLHIRIRAHEEGWIQIEEITDHNKDGDVIIHCKHIEDQHDD